MCAVTMIHSRFRKLVFGAADLKGGAAGSVTNVFDVNKWNHRVEVVAGIIEEDCAKF